MQIFAFNIGINGRFADKNLESSQKMLLGGLSGVRGHQAGAASVDEAYDTNRIQTLFTSLSQSVLVSSLFYDYGLGNLINIANFSHKA